MGSGKAPSKSPLDDDSLLAPPSGSGSKSSPAPEKSSARSPPPPDDDSSPPPPSPKKSPPPPDKSSPPPPDEATPPPPSPKKSPPPAESPPPPSPTPADASRPPSSPPAPSKGNKSPPATTPSPPKQKPTSSPPAQTSPAEGTKSPAPPVDGVDAGTPPAPTRDTVNSPPGKAFVAPAPALASNQSATGDRSSGSSVSKGGSSSSHAGAIAGGVIGGVLFVMFVVCIWMFCRRKKKQQKNYNQIWNHSPSPDHKHHAINIPPGGPGWQPSSSPGYLPPRPPPGASDSGYSPYYANRPTPAAGSMLPPFSPEIGGSMNPNHLAYEDLVAATDGFANANMLGQGGFGYVHKGVLPGGKEVAVKCLKSGSGQGEREFQAEVDIISRVHHRHLVSLVGYSIANEKRLLVYEYVPNNTLEYHLHKSRNTPLDFSTRVRIALGSAKGLAYLHEDCHPRIIHRDIKAANILLDYNFEAQVADFGLARLSNDANTHVSTRVMGTFGYLAPEYASSGKLTDKSDVFSFGVVLLELITGRRPIDPNDQSMEDDSLVDWARPLLSKAVSEGIYDELVDRRLEGNYNPQEMTNMVACAAASIRHSAKRRPRMSQIVRTLEGDMSGLDGTRTGLSTPGSNDYDTAAYNADMKKFRQLAFGTLELDGGSVTTTGEFDLNHSSSTSVTSSNANSPRKT